MNLANESPRCISLRGWGNKYIPKTLSKDCKPVRVNAFSCSLRKFRSSSKFILMKDYLQEAVMFLVILKLHFFPPFSYYLPLSSECTLGSFIEREDSGT